MEGYFDMMARQQAAEIATIAPRTLTLNLSEADTERIALHAAKAGMTVGQLLESFIGDLVGGTYSNGSDERDYADRWYERCGFTYMATSDVAILAKWDSLDTMVDYCESYKAAVEELAYFQEEIGKDEDITEEDIKNAQEWVAESRADVERLMKDAKCTGTLEAVMKEVLQWKADLDAFKGA